MITWQRHQYVSNRNCRHALGFTLIELLVTITIIGILSAIAIPNYSAYMKQGYAVDATNTLAGMRAKLEQHYQDNRAYTTVGDFKTPCTDATVGKISVTCNIAQDTFVVTATGIGPAAGFVYTINEKNAQETKSLPSGWGSATTACWITKKGGQC